MSKNITREQFIKKYGQNVVKFDSYYKYAFSFKGYLKDGGSLFAVVGENLASLYSLSVNSNNLIKVEDLPLICGAVHDKNGNEIEYFYGGVVDGEDPINSTNFRRSLSQLLNFYEIDKAVDLTNGFLVDYILTSISTLRSTLHFIKQQELEEERGRYDSR